jgi:general secretion pathway protein J
MNGAPRGARGFTLLELLVAMTLLALLAGLLFGGLSFGVRVWEKGDAELEKMAELQIAQGLIRRLISRALVTDLAKGEDEGAVIFEGTAEAVRFVGPAPAQSLPGGFYRLSIRADDVSGKSRLVMSWRLLDPDERGAGAGAGAGAGTGEGEDEDENVVVLVENIADVSLAFFGADNEDGDGEPRWQDRWEDMPGLPLLVRMTVTFPEGDRRIWPELVVAPMVTPPAP